MFMGHAGMNQFGGSCPDIYRMAPLPTAENALRMPRADAVLPDLLMDAVLVGVLVGRGMEPGGESPLMALVEAVRKNMQDQAAAALFYTALMEQAEIPIVREYIRHARDDEQKHLRMLGALHRELTGETYEPRPEPTPFGSLQEGLVTAMNNEYEAFEEYRRIHLTYRDECVSNIFFELMTDELEHVTRFIYALQVLPRVE